MTTPPDRDPAEPAAAPPPPDSESGTETTAAATDAAPDAASTPQPAPAEALEAPGEPAPPVSGAQTRAGFETRGPEPLVAAPDPRLLEVLVCPVTRGMLEYDKAAHELVSRSAKLAYPIRDGIPIMLPEEARALTDAEA